MAKFAVFLMQIVYCIFKLFPRKYKIVYISRQSDDITLDFELLYKRIEEFAPEIEQVVLTKKIGSGIVNKLKYVLHMMEQMYHIATSRVVILDGYCIAASVLKHKKGTKILQIWHALGAIKCFGYQTLDKEEGSSSSLAKDMKMHKNYDSVICASNATAKMFSEAFNMPYEKFKILGMPRVDYICDEQNKNDLIYNRHPEYKDKKTILYIPTFRKGKNIYLDDLINLVDEKKYNLIVKLHPLDETPVDERFLIESEYNTYDLMKFADFIITDYSAVAIEASVLNKPLFFYIYDYKNYVGERGLNIDPCKEMSNATSENAVDIMQSIYSDQYDFDELERFRNKYIETLSFSNTNKIGELIISLANN